MGEFIPIMNVEVLPGDSFIQRTSLMCRIAPLVNPVMHNVAVRVHHWYVPTRLIWPEFEEWIVGQDDQSEKPTITNAPGRDLVDHLGIPPAASVDIDAIPVMALNKIWNEYYRDQDLDAERDEMDVSIPRIRWEKDYFTTARTADILGDAVKIPFDAGSGAPISGLGTDGGNPWNEGPKTIWETGGRQTQYDNSSKMDSASQEFYAAEDPNNRGYPLIYADLANMEGGIDVNDLRRSIALQNFAEVRAMFGSRYVDYLRYLGVNPGDNRMSRPEYLGGGSSDVNFSEVLAMAEGQTTQVGDMYGHGIAGLRANRYRRRFPEHGWVFSVLSVRPKTVYMDGIQRKYTRFDPMDYWQKELEILPWQEVKEREIHHAGAADTVWGYVPRYDEYRHELSYVSGSFRDGPEIDWHMARKFDTPPTLNSSFVNCDPTDRIYGDTEMPELLVNTFHEISAARLVRSTTRNRGVIGL